MREPLLFEPVEKPEDRSLVDGLFNSITEASIDKEAFMGSNTAQMLAQPDADGNTHDVGYLYDNDLPPTLQYADASDKKIMTDAVGAPEVKAPEVKAPEVKAPEKDMSAAANDQVEPKSDAQNVLDTGDLWSWPKKNDPKPAVDNSSLTWDKRSTTEHTLVYGGENGREKGSPAEAHLIFSRILYEYANRANMTPSEMEGGDISQIRAQRLDFEKQRALESKNATDDKVALWGHQTAGQLTHGFASSILNVASFDQKPLDVQIATLNLLNLRQNKNGDTDWDGVVRASVFDIFNLVGLTSLKFFSAPFTGAKAYTGKKIIDGMINTVRRGKLMAAMGAEGNIYASSFEMMQQYRKIEVGEQKEYDWGKIGLAGAIGTGLGGALSLAPGAVKALNTAAVNMAASPGTLRMGVGPTDTPPPIAEPFYSAVSRAVDTLPQEKGSGDQMRAMISKSGGVKQDEMAWIGLDDFLKGKKNVTKQEIKEYVDANQVRIEEITKNTVNRDNRQDVQVDEMDFIEVINDEHRLQREADFVVSEHMVVGRRMSDDVVDDTQEILIAERLDHNQNIDLADDMLKYARLIFDNDEVFWNADGSGLKPEIQKLLENFKEQPELYTDELRDLINNSEIGGASANTGSYSFDETMQGLGLFDIFNPEGNVIGTARTLDDAEFQARLYLESGNVGDGKGDTKFGSYTLPGGENYRELLLTLPDKGGNRLKQINQELQEIDSALEQAGDMSKYDKFSEFAKAEIYKSRDKFVQKRADLIAEKKSLGNVENYQGGHYEEPNVLAHVRLNDRTGPNGEKILFVEEIQSDWHQTGRDKGYQGDIDYDALRAKQQEVFEEKNAIGTDVTAQGYDATQAQQSRYMELDNEYKAIQKQLDGNANEVPDAPMKKSWHEMSFRRIARIAAEEGYDSVSWTPGKMQAERYNLSKQVSEVRAIKHEDGTVSLGYIPPGGGNRRQLKSFIPAEELDEFIGKEMAEKIRGQNEETVDYSGVDLEVGSQGMKGFYDKMVKNYAQKWGKKFGAKVETTNIDSGGEKITTWSMKITQKMRDSLMKKGVPLFGAAGAAATIGMQGEGEQPGTM